jgi:hypothetical protein
MRKILRIIIALAVCLLLVGVAGMITTVVANDTDKGVEAATIALVGIPVLFFVGVLAANVYLAARATGRGAHRAVWGAARIADRALYAVGIDTRKIAERWNERK